MSYVDIEGYRQTITTPWSKVFYELVWSNISFSNKKILDFGSGFGLTSNYLAQHNDVLAVEPNEAMLEYRYKEHSYTQYKGSIEHLIQIPSETFDVIICHNVLEYYTDRELLFHEFYRLLKPDGVVSIVKHHREGKIMQKIVFEHNIDEAMELLSDGKAKSLHFGEFNEYSEVDLLMLIHHRFKIEKRYGVRMFFGLQNDNAMKYEEGWKEQMFMIEKEVEEIPTFRDIAFFHHLHLKKECL